MNGEVWTEAAGGPAPTGWGITAQLPPQIRRRMIDADHDDRQAERDAEAERDRRYEEAANRALALGIASAHARGEYPAPMELATVRLPADDKERDARTQAAIQHVLDTQRAQYQRELDWEKEHPSPPAGPPERLHVFFDDPVLQPPAPVARSAIGLRIFNRARRFGEAQRTKEAAERAAAASRDDFGFVCERRTRADDDPIVVARPPFGGRRRAARDDGLRFR
jgi:hypothetical protein